VSRTVSRRRKRPLDKRNLKRATRTYQSAKKPTLRLCEPNRRRKRKRRLLLLLLLLEANNTPTIEALLGIFLLERSVVDGPYF